MYVARYDLDGEPLAVAALPAPRAAVSAVPPAWVHRLLAATACFFAVRLTATDSGMAALLLLNASDADELERLCIELMATVPPAEGARVAESEVEFDRLVRAPDHALWLDHAGYQVDGHAMATDFRLYPQIESIAQRTAGLVYQCCFRPYRVEPERRREIRKYLAALRLDSPFPPAVTDLQSTLAARLLENGFLIDELLGFPERDSLDKAVAAIEESFRSTMGAFGFRQSPVEPGDYRELFTTGLHSSLFGGGEHFISHAAATLSTEESRQFLQLRLGDGAAPPSVAPAAGGGPPVFLSYSSSDFTQAWSACQFLERHGMRCWIAPRNVLPGESYPEAIVRGLAAARALVVFVSGASNLSPHVHREIERALHNRAVIIPMRVQPIEPTGAMEYLLSTCQWLDAYAEFEQSLDELLRRLRGLLGR